MFLKLVRDFRKLPLKRIFILGTLVLCLLGYQPVLSFPPIRRVKVLAQEPQQTIRSQSISQPFILPHPGYISTRFSFRHPGVDIATGLGMPIHPILDGKVVTVEYTFFGLGYFVVIEHEGGYKSTYGHMGRIYIKVGDEVKQSTIMGEVGLTGRTSGPHTHLELTRNGSYLDPLKSLPALADYPRPTDIRPAGGPEQNPQNETVEKAPILNLRKELKFNL